MRVLVTGVSGYIGAHIASELISNGHSVYGIDNLSTGFKEFNNPEIKFFLGDISDRNFLDQFLKSISSNEEISVIHAAGLKYAGESVLHPLDFYKVNTTGTEVLLSALKKFGIKNFVFSSSCSVYGSIQNEKKVTEDDLLNPASPYGRSKYFAEQILNDAVAAGQISGVALRYFNVIGNASVAAHDRSPFNLVPNIFRSFESGDSFKVFGNDYATKDGTCIRDYVDAVSLAKAHVVALEKLVLKEKILPAYNLGSSLGFSTLEVVNAAISATGKQLKVEFKERREGDPAIIQADITAAKRDLAWKHESSLEEMITASWVSWEKFKIKENLNRF